MAKDPEVRSRLAAMAKAAKSPADRAAVQEIIRIFDSAPGDDTPDAVVAFLNKHGAYDDEKEPPAVG